MQNHSNENVLIGMQVKLIFMGKVGGGEGGGGLNRGMFGILTLCKLKAFSFVSERGTSRLLILAYRLTCEFSVHRRQSFTLGYSHWT